MIAAHLLCTIFLAVVVHGTLASSESSQEVEGLWQRRHWQGLVSPNESLPCVDFVKSACLRGTTSAALRHQLLAEFNEQLDKELDFAHDVDRLLDDLKEERPVLEKEGYIKELSKKCDDGNFLWNYLVVAMEENGNTPPKAENHSCIQMISNITKIVLSDGKESIDELTDVIRKVRDMIAFDNLRTKNSQIKEAFRLTRNFFDTVHSDYLDFIRAFDLVHSTDAANWYQLAENLQLQLPMRSNKFFRKEQLDVLTTEYFSCKNNWILDIDQREKRLCLSRAWGLATGQVPMPGRLAQVLHDLRSLRVNIESGLVYVRPAYAQLLLDTKDYAVLLGTLGFEIAREITRASYTVPPETLRCFEERLNIKCSEKQENCSLKTLDYIYDTVALRAVLSILQKMEISNADMRIFFYSIPILICEPKVDKAANVVVSQVDDHQIAFECAPSSPMVSSKEDRCELI